MPNNHMPLSDADRKRLVLRLRSVAANRDEATIFALERWNDIARYEATVRALEQQLTRKNALLQRSWSYIDSPGSVAIKAATRGGLLEDIATDLAGPPRTRAARGKAADAT